MNPLYATAKRSDEHGNNPDKVYALDMGNFKVDRFGISDHRSLYLVLNPMNRVGVLFPRIANNCSRTFSTQMMAIMP